MTKTINNHNMVNAALRLLTIAFAATTLTGCGLYKKYERPDISVDGIVRDTARIDAVIPTSADTTSFGDVAWQEVFTDPQLQTLISKGLENNNDIFAAAANVKKLEAALSCARLAFLPSVVFSPSGTLSKVVTGDKKSDWSKSYALPISASWTVDIFGGILATKRNAEMNLAMARDMEHVTRSKVICGVANSYYTLLMLDRQLEILNDMDKLTGETYEMMKLQKELRGAKETSVVSAKAANLRVKADIVDMQRQIREVENALSLLIGQSAQSIARGKLADQTLPEQFSAGCSIALLRNRPDVHAAEMKLAACFYSVEKARSSFYPKLTISGTGSFTNSLGSVIANPGQLLANFVAGLTQPIFQNGRLVAELKVAKLDYEVAERDWRQSVLNAGAEVSNSLVEYNSARQSGDLDRQQVEALTKGVDYTLQLYRMGSSSYLEVLTAQSSLLNAEISQVVDDFNKMQAVVNLYSALGGGR